nr:MATE family efflux transporter [Thermoflavimicrobium dichotomicum]
MWQSLILFFIPLVFSNVLQSLGGTVSSVLIGLKIGENALAAASAVFPITFFLVSFVIGLGSASSILIGQAFGSKKLERMKSTVGTSLTFSFLLGILSASAGILFSDSLLALIKTPAEIKADASKYMHVLFAGLPVLFLYVIYTTFLRGSGDSKTPFYFLVISTGLTILFTPMFLFGWGVPAMGLEGAALAQIVASFISFLLLVGYLLKIKHPLALDRETIKKLRLDPQILRLMIKIGLPTSIQMIVVSLSEIAIVTFVNHFGAQATAAYGAITQVINYVQIPAMSLGIAIGIFGAQLIGANRQDRLDELVKATVILNYAIGIVLTGLAYIFSRPILSMFLTDPMTVDIAQKSLYITLWSFILLGNVIIISGLMRSSGTVFWPTLLVILGVLLVELPAAYILSRTLGLYGVWLAYPISFTVLLIGQYVYYRKFWKNRTHERFFDKPEEQPTS